MRECDFNKVACNFIEITFRHGRSKFAGYFQSTFLQEQLSRNVCELQILVSSLPSIKECLVSVTKNYSKTDIEVFWSCPISLN